MAMQCTVGQVARGGSFFNRQELVDLLWSRLEQGNVLLAGPRRFGKTSLMYRLIDEPRPGWRIIHVDAESIWEPASFIIALLDALRADQVIQQFLAKSWRKASKKVRSLLDEIGLSGPLDAGVKIKLKDLIRADWAAYAQDLLGDLRNCKEKILIIIDELPVMLEHFHDNDVKTPETRRFLYWFRSLRIDPKVNVNNCHFLTGGSIGIDRCLARLNAGPAFNDFERITIDELTDKQARALLRALLEGGKVAVTHGMENSILKLIGTRIPYFIQVFIAEIIARQSQGATKFGAKTLESIYLDNILSVTHKSYFQYYYDRLRYYDKQDEQVAKVMLKELSLVYPGSVTKERLRQICRETRGGQASDERFEELVAELQNDFYIKVTPQGYVFASKILCDWWRRYYAL